MNLTAAQDFIELLTSPRSRPSSRRYLATSDPGGAPFVADASPTSVTRPRDPRDVPGAARRSRSTARRRTPSRATRRWRPDGHGRPARRRPAGSRWPAARPLHRRFRSRSRRPSTGAYEVSTRQIAQIEDSDAEPRVRRHPVAGGDTAGQRHRARRDHRASDQVARAARRSCRLGGPGRGHGKATVTVLARTAGSKGGFKRVGHRRLRPVTATSPSTCALAAGSWQFKLSYARRPARSWPPPAGRVTLTVGANPPPASAARSRSQGAQGDDVTAPVAAESAARSSCWRCGPPAARPFGTIGPATSRARRFTLHAKLRRGRRWVLQLEYLRRRSVSFSGLSGHRTVGGAWTRPHRSREQSQANTAAPGQSRGGGPLCASGCVGSGRWLPVAGWPPRPGGGGPAVVTARLGGSAGGVSPRRPGRSPRSRRCPLYSGPTRSTSTPSW